MRITVINLFQVCTTHVSSWCQPNKAAALEQSNKLSLPTNTFPALMGTSGKDFRIRDIVSSSDVVSGAVMKKLSWPDHLSLSCLMARRKASAEESSWTYPQRCRSLSGLLAKARDGTDQ